eukprot:scpid47882/ scgid31914/ 
MRSLNARGMLSTERSGLQSFSTAETRVIHVLIKQISEPLCLLISSCLKQVCLVEFSLVLQVWFSNMAAQHFYKNSPQDTEVRPDHLAGKTLSITRTSHSPSPDSYQSDHVSSLDPRQAKRMPTCKLCYSRRTSLRCL